MENKRNLNIEFLRIIACFMVVATHVCPELIHDDGNIADGALIMRTLCCGGVGIFFLIAGCFLDRTSVRKAWMNFAKRIVVPSLVFTAAMNLLDKWLSGQTSPIQSILSINLRGTFFGILKGLLAFNADQLGPACGHLWYIFSYAIIMLWLPLLLPLIKAKKHKALFFFAVLSLMRLIIIDINKLWAFPLQIYLPELPPVELTYAVSGYLLYQYMPVKKNNFPALPLICAAAASIFIFLLIYAQRLLFAAELLTGCAPCDIRDSPYYLNWLSGTGVLLALFIMAAVLGLPKSLFERFRKPITLLGSLTFPVYLIHFPLVYKLRVCGLESIIKELFNAQTGPGTIIFTFVYSVFIFILTIAVWEVLANIINYISRVLPLKRLPFHIR